MKWEFDEIYKGKDFDKDNWIEMTSAEADSII